MIESIQGGIVNSGNSCFLAVVIQDLASESEFYDKTLSTRLSQRDVETSLSFEARNRLQKDLRSAVDEIRNCKTLKAERVKTLRKDLRDVGWKESRQSFFHRIIFRVFNRPPPGDTFAAYNTICNALDQQDYQIDKNVDPFFKSFGQEVGSHKVVHGLDCQRPLQDRLSKLPEFSNGKTLCKFRTNPSINMKINEIFSNYPQSQLRQVHVYQGIWIFRHHLIYRKIGDQWFRFNDQRVSKVDQLPSFGISRVVFWANSVLKK